jgi:hypothetical protein
MKEIFLTQEGKKEIESKISELEDLKEQTNHTLTWNEAVCMVSVYKTILQYATILSIEENFDNIISIVNMDSECKNSLEKVHYPKGVIVNVKK